MPPRKRARSPDEPDEPSSSPKRRRTGEWISGGEQDNGEGSSRGVGGSPSSLTSRPAPLQASVEEVEDSEEVIDLLQGDEVPAQLLEPPPPPEPPKPKTKLGAQVCPICFDHMTNVTATHCGKWPPPWPGMMSAPSTSRKRGLEQMADLVCYYPGHLFCFECIHRALLTMDRRSCPICRTRIEIKHRTRGLYPIAFLKTKPSTSTAT